MKTKCFSSPIMLVLLIMSISTTYSQKLNITKINLEEKTVTNTNDSGLGSLREAIYAANHYLHLDRNIIRFKIPKTDPGYDINKGIWTIKPDSSFEYIVDNGLIIDGFSQSAFIGEDTNPYGPEIVIDGSSAGTYSSCLVTYAEGNEIYGLTINSFGGVGILFYNPGFGRVSGCYLGTDYSGMNAAGNKFGIALWYKVQGVHIGPSEYAYPNIISGNTQTGIFLADSSKYNIIVGNYIGLNRNKNNVISNDLRGIDLERGCEGNEIFDNHIGGNGDGITIIRSNDNIIANNFIGSNESLEADYGNYTGILLWGNSSNNKIIGNTIGHNSGNGVSVDSVNSVRNIISRNSISQNDGLGIDNMNGGNMELNPPTITSVSSNIIKGTSGANQIIEIFADGDDEGRILIDSVVTDAQGNFVLGVFGLPELPNITATARDITGNTSEFSVPYVVTNVEESTFPQKFHLSQNYPNPFNTRTVISWQVGATGQSSVQVDLSIYNVLGQKVTTLIAGKQKAGLHTVEWDASGFASGVYYYRLVAGEYVATRKLVFVK